MLCYSNYVQYNKPRIGHNLKARKSLQLTILYSLTKKKVPICQKFFLNIFGIKKYRVEYLMKKYYETGEFPREARGGDRYKICG